MICLKHWLKYGLLFWDKCKRVLESVLWNHLHIHIFSTAQKFWEGTDYFAHLIGKLFNITVIQVYSPGNNAEEAEVEWFYEDL